MSAWACVSGSVCECVPVDVSVPVSVDAGESARGRSGQAQPPGLPASSTAGMGLAWGQVLSSCYEEAAFPCQVQGGPGGRQVPPAERARSDMRRGGQGMGSDGPADRAGVDQPQAQGPPGRWTQLWVHPQVRDNPKSRGGAVARGTCRGGAARGSAGADARGRRDALWGLKTWPFSWGTGGWPWSGATGRCA